MVSRLNTVIFGTDSVGYQYLANSPLLEHVYFTNGTTRRMTTTRTYDNLTRLTSIQTSVGATLVKSLTYKYNLADQRTNVTFLDSSFWEYAYDSLGQVNSAKRHVSPGVPMFGQQYEYAFDDIGNRKFAASGGNEWGQLRYANYTANNLNQYAQRINPGEVDVTGAAALSATVTVNDFPTLRQGEYYWAEVPTSNHLGARLLSLTNYGVINDGSQDLVSEVKGNLLIPAAQETFTHDFDGNLTADSLWNYTWDAENRLIKMATAAGLPQEAERRVEFEYDWRGRRIRKRVHDRVTAGAQILDEKYLWDGWNLTAVLNGTNNSVIRSFVWGADLSGTFDGVRGVGGLLAVKDTAQGLFYAAYDGGGNVSALIRSADGVVGAEYEYSAFAETIRATGPMAKANPFRFGTKFTDDESGFLSYPLRYEVPSQGRWLNRDPLLEAGGMNLYSFCLNATPGWGDDSGAAVFPFPYFPLQWPPRGDGGTKGGGSGGKGGAGKNGDGAGPTGGFPTRGELPGGTGPNSGTGSGGGQSGGRSGGPGGGGNHGGDRHGGDWGNPARPGVVDPCDNKCLPGDKLIKNFKCHTYSAPGYCAMVVCCKICRPEASTPRDPIRLQQCVEDAAREWTYKCDISPVGLDKIQILVIMASPCNKLLKCYNTYYD